MPHGLSAGQVEVIKRHLALVFKHEIEPSGAEEKKINAPLPAPYVPWPITVPGDGTAVPYPYTSPIIYCRESSAAI